MLTSPLSNAATARQVGCSKAAIAMIRLGHSRADLWPELPRKVAKPQPRGGPSCYDCRAWRDGRCLEGLPDPVEEGPLFAADCDFYDQKA